MRCRSLVRCPVLWAHVYGNYSLITVSSHTPLQDADDGRRSRRARKSVNYAELNDVYLPPLGPQDFVGGETVPSAPGTRSRMRRNDDVYIQEDYLAPRVRSTSTRRRWREIEEGDVEEITREEEEGKLDEGSGSVSPPSDVRDCGSKGNLSASLSPDARSQGSLEVITEEVEGEEDEVESTTPNVVQIDAPATGLCHFEVTQKKPRFSRLENSGDLASVNILVQQSLSPPVHLPHFNIPHSFHALPTKHHTPSNFSLHQPPLTHHAPSFHVNQASPIHHPPSCSVQYSSSLSSNVHTLAAGSSILDGANSSKQCAYTMSANHNVNSSSKHTIPLFRHKEDAIERRTSAGAPTPPSLSIVNDLTNPNQNL